MSRLKIFVENEASIQELNYISGNGKLFFTSYFKFSAHPRQHTSNNSKLIHPYYYKINIKFVKYLFLLMKFKKKKKIEFKIILRSKTNLSISLELKKIIFFN